MKAYHLNVYANQMEKYPLYYKERIQIKRLLFLLSLILSVQVMIRKKKVFMTKATAIMLFKEIMFIEEPTNKQLYNRIFVTSSDLRDILTKQFGQINATARRIDRWLSSDGTWDDETTCRLNKVPYEG
ncbi:unnamed protein product [Rhizopus stolonifer]